MFVCGRIFGGRRCFRRVVRGGCGVWGGEDLAVGVGLGMKRAQKIIIELRGIVDLTKTSEEDSTLLKDEIGRAHV